MSTASIIDKLKEIRDTNLVNVYIPSLRAHIKFKQLSLKQQKDIIKTGLEGALAGLYLDNTINNIITENSLAQHNFLVIDKVSIILALRASSLGTLCKIDDDIVDIKPLLEKELNFSLNLTKELNFNDLVKVKLSVPSLERELLTNNSQLSELINNKDLKVSDAIGSLYVYEVVKFVESIQIDSDTLQFNTLHPKDMVRVVEGLPATLNNDIIKFIQDFRSVENEFLTIEGKTVNVDARFFAVDS